MIAQRLGHIQRYLKKNNRQAMLISCESNVRYLSGFTGDECRLLITPHQALFLGDFRYILQAQKEAGAYFEIVKVSGSVIKAIHDTIHKLQIRSVCFEPRYISVAFFNQLTAAPERRIQWIAVEGVVEKFREIKNPRELALIRKAVTIAKKSLHKLKPHVRPGVSEWELKKMLERILAEQGAQAPSFDIIVASGPNAAMPHAKTTARKIRAGEPVIVDAGAVYRGYKSDLTRTFFSGKMTQYAHYYQLVATAQTRAIERIRPGISAGKIDQAARRVFEAAEVDKYFGHALGHGVGLDVHEAPVIAGSRTERLRPGMVFTVEPGLYVPGWGGIRIEDMVMVTDNGCEVL